MKKFRFCSFIKQLPEFKEGIEFQNKKQFLLSEQSFKRCQDILIQQNQTQSKDYIEILRKLAQLSQNAEKYPKYAKQILQISKSLDENIYKIYEQNLIIYLIKNDLQESEKFVDEIKNNQQFYLATIQLLQNEQQKSYDNYKQFLQESEDNILKAYAYNNICIDNQDHKENIQNFNKSLKILEQYNKEYKGTVLMNLSDSLFLNEQPQESGKILNETLKFYEQNYPDQVYKILIQLAIYGINNDQFMKAEGLFRACLEMTQDPYYEYLIYLNYSNMLLQMEKRVDEGQLFKQKAQELKQKHKIDMRYLNLLIGEIIE